MPLIPSIVNWLNVKRIHQINLFKKYPVEVQDEQLTQLIDLSKDTTWGLKHKYSSIRNYEEFNVYVGKDFKINKILYRYSGPKFRYLVEIYSMDKKKS